MRRNFLLCVLAKFLGRISDKNIFPNDNPASVFKKSAERNFFFITAHACVYDFPARVMLNYAARHFNGQLSAENIMCAKKRRFS